MEIPIFLSYPQPHLKNQIEFINTLTSMLLERGMIPRTLGVNEYDLDVPLRAVRRLMLESNGIITVALRRTWIQNAVVKRNADITVGVEKNLNDVWFTSPWCQIEPAMAFQLGLPILLLREEGVYDEGVMEKGVVGLYTPKFSLQGDPLNYLRSAEWLAIYQKWETRVHHVVEKKGEPPSLY